MANCRDCDRLDAVAHSRYRLRISTVAGVVLWLTLFAVFLVPRADDVLRYIGSSVIGATMGAAGYYLLMRAAIHHTHERAHLRLWVSAIARVAVVFLVGFLLLELLALVELR